MQINVIHSVGILAAEIWQVFFILIQILIMTLLLSQTVFWLKNFIGQQIQVM